MTTRSNLFLITTSVVTLLLGASCSMIPSLETPQNSVAETWNMPMDYPAPAGNTAIDQIDWQTYFNDPQLQQIIQTVLDHNKDLRLAILNMDEARALYRIKKSDILPSIDGNAGATIQGASDESQSAGQPSKTENYALNAGLNTYEIDLFGRVRSLNDAALNDFFASQANIAVVRNALIAESANAYLQLMSDLKLLSLTEQTLIAQQNTHDLLSISLDKGIGTELDVSRAETAVEIARVNYHQYKRQVEQDKNALTLLMGIAHNNEAIPLSNLDNIAINDSIQAGLPSQILLNRPDVKQAEYTLIARNADIGAARAAFFPSITLTGSYGFASKDLTDLISGGAFGAWSFLPNVTIPIFSGGANKANLDLSEIRKDKAIATYEKTIQVAFREVSDELAARTTLTEQLNAQNRLVAAAQKVYDVSDARYKSGIDSFLSVLDAQRELYTYQQNKIETERQRLANLVNLYKVLGGDYHANSN